MNPKTEVSADSLEKMCKTRKLSEPQQQWEKCAKKSGTGAAQAKLLLQPSNLLMKTKKPGRSREDSNNNNLDHHGNPLRQLYQGSVSRKVVQKGINGVTKPRRKSSSLVVPVNKNGTVPKVPGPSVGFPRGTTKPASEFDIRKYEQLALSLQSPLPNEHQFGLEMCLILSAVGEKSPKRLNVIEKVPALLNMLLAHAGFYSDCALRSLFEQTYREAFGKEAGLDFTKFWERICCRDGSEDDSECETYDNVEQFLCECYPGKSTEMSETEKGILYGIGNEDSTRMKCCHGCRAKLPGQVVQDNYLPYTRTLSKIQTSESSLAIEKIEDRVQLVGEILRNFSFDNGNTTVMAKNSTLLRFLLAAVQTGYRSFPQIAFDIISNISKNTGRSSLEGECDNALSRLKYMLADFVAGTFLLSNDRFKILRSAEAIRGLALSGDERCQLLFTDARFFERLFQLLTLKEDTILAINCLECTFAATEMSEATCNEIVRVPGFLTTLLTYVTDGPPVIINKLDVTNNSTRITALLIIRNIVKYSCSARRSLRRYESHLANLAMSEDDSSWILAQILYYMTEDDNSAQTNINENQFS